MALFTTLAALSQTPASNAPDGATDAPSTLDDQLRLLASFVAQLRDGVGFTGQLGTKNRVRNGNFAINQRAVSGTVTIAAGVYGHDGWKAGAAGCSYTFSTTGLDTTINIASGSLIQVIEGLDIEGGNYVMSWGGTATGKIGAGALSASGVTAAGVTAAANLNIEFSTGTLTRVQMEPGLIASAFERRSYATELVKCQRFYQTSYQGVVPGTAAANQGRIVDLSSSTSSYGILRVYLPVLMRAIPTVAIYNPATGTFTIRNETAGTDFGIANVGTGSVSPNYFAYQTATSPPASAVISMHYTASAEL